MNIFCRTGWHNWKPVIKWVPNIHAEIVEEVIFNRFCKRCKQKELIFHWIWEDEKRKSNSNRITKSI